MVIDFESVVLVWSSNHRATHSRDPLTDRQRLPRVRLRHERVEPGATFENRVKRERCRMADAGQREK
jgi:hypothetical protein